MAPWTVEKTKELNRNNPLKLGRPQGVVTFHMIGMGNMAMRHYEAHHSLYRSSNMTILV